jgi:membrane protein
MTFSGSRIAFLAAENLTESEIVDAIQILEDSGARVDVIGPRSREIHLLRHAQDGVTERIPLAAAHALDQIATADYDGVALPAALLRNGSFHVDADVLRFIGDMQAEGKPLLSLPVPGRTESRAPESVASPPFSLKLLLADSWRNWNAIHAPRLGAALAYYTLLSLAPLSILIVAATSIAMHQSAAEAGLLRQVEALLGNQVADIVRAVLEHGQSAGVIASTVGALILLIGASGVFLELRDSLNMVWGVEPTYGDGALGLARARAFGFVLVLGTGLAVLVLLFLSTILAVPGQFLMKILPVDQHLMQLLTNFASLLLLTLIFALIFKVIPDARIRWSDVWIGAFVTALLFTAGKFLIALYLAKASIGSAYAAAGSIVVFLTWVYYSAQIFLFGAEFTHVYTQRYGSHSKSPKTRPLLPGRYAA